jgi:uncharacterized iron-regulated protein
MKSVLIAVLSAGVLTVGGCALWPSGHAAPTLTQPHEVPALLSPLLPAPFVLLGELHDVDGHQQLQRQVIEYLAQRTQLHAVVLEMAERGHSTSGLLPLASEAQVQNALQWNSHGWPWGRYGPVVMAAVRQGVPVFGGNLPRNDMLTTMRNTALDESIGAKHLAPLQALMQESHCGLLPQSQLQPMARIQIGRDVAMAQTLLAARPTQPQQVTLLITGNQHARKDYGVPWHLQRLGVPTQEIKVVHMQTEGASQLFEGADALWTSAPAPPKDHCTDLRERMAPQGQAS